MHVASQGVEAEYMYQTSTVGVVVDNVNDLFSIPFLLQYNPAVTSVEEVRHGGFLQAGDQAIAIVLQVDKEHGQAHRTTVFFVCRKTGTQPQTRQCHAGSVIQRTLFQIAIPIRISTFRKLRNAADFGPRYAFLLSVRHLP